MTDDTANLDQLCTLYGIATEYTDIWGKTHTTSQETRRALLGAMGCAVGEEADSATVLAAARTRAWERSLPPVWVCRTADSGSCIPLRITAEQADTLFEWTLKQENGTFHSGQLRPADMDLLEASDGAGIRRECRAFPLPFMPDCGYHEITLAPVAQPEQGARSVLIVAPERGYQPPVLTEGKRVWGPGVQLYSVRSQRNWGIGDMGDLRLMLDGAAELGASLVGLNPLHELFPAFPEQVSPYSPSSRLFYNVLYLDVLAIPEYPECQPAQQMVGDALFQARLRALRSADLVDYPGVAAVKIPVLELLFRHFRDHHLNGPRGQSFRDFQNRHGETLRFMALYEALQEHFLRQEGIAWDWPHWPDDYRDPHSPACQSFAVEHSEWVEFYAYLQWRLAKQLEDAGRHSMELGLGIGLYEDLAVSVNRGGAETWAHQDLYALNVSVGAPPDHFNPQGQNWDLPPVIPQRLREAGYAPFIAMLRENMRHAGALRIDHIMGLMRLYWVPNGGSPQDGAYVDYPLDDLLNILVLESVRNRCLVIGEDLGTVPETLRDTLAERGILSYRLLYFEKNEDGSFIPPAEYPEQALVAVGTHDLPTLNGFWQGRDLELRDELRLVSSPEMREGLIVERAQDRAWLRMSLEREELLPPDVNVHKVSTPELTPEFVLAVHLYLARTPARILLVKPEDVFTQTEQFNFPGTVDQYPNWRHKLTVALENWTEEPGFQALVQGVQNERGIPEPVQAPINERPLSACIPDSTYRFQFNSAFTFSHAAQRVPYLQALGISHCYASSYLRARPGSMHGYDIIDHNALNPEIGDGDEFNAFCEALRQHGMGQILDMVPNHMGVMGSDNAWWLDVLENGPAAVHASYFDIDWFPLPEGLWGKILLPVLGDHYGVVLENGQLKLRYDEESGSFSVLYYEHRFPVDPGTYPRILGNRIDVLEARMGADNFQFLEYQSIVTALGHLPGRMKTAPEQIVERTRDKELHKRRLLDLCRQCSDIRWFVEEKLEEFNGKQGEPASFDPLHQLLQEQAYRLAFWRVASDDINYRRFFDINDLAGLRMENDAVFEDTHRFVMELIGANKLDGLRIDHPDGLYDPRQYFQRLQEAVLSQAGRIPNSQTAQSKPLYVVVEKILESYERLPEQWPVHGTTGYEFANLVNGLLINGEAEDRFNSIYEQFIGEPIVFEDLLYECKKLIMQVALASELNVLANQLSRIAQVNRRTQDYTLNGLKSALTEIVACFPVYRTYISAEGVSEEDQRYIDWAVSVARKRSQAADVSIFDFVRDVLLTTGGDDAQDAYRDQIGTFAMKFQQYTGPLMAKGLEDTSFYRYYRLASVNEVGGDPRRFAVSLSGFHHANQERARLWPHAMLSTSTHDSKRSEDVRARISVLSEMADEWERLLQRWGRLNNAKKRWVDDELAPSRNDEYLLYQTLLGAWPLEPMDETTHGIFRERIESYMLKAVKEAKQHSSWINPSSEYEGAVIGFVGELLAEPEKNRFLEDFLPFQKRIARFGLFNSLSQTLLKLTCPGMPDIYQGTELWNFSLVDPDNRRPVDYQRRQTELDALREGFAAAPEQQAKRARNLLETMEDGRIKLYTTWKTLNLRRECPALFREGEYRPLDTLGERAGYVCVFARSGEAEEVIVITPLLVAGLLEGDETRVPLGENVWGDTRIQLPTAASYLNLFTGERLTPPEGEEATLPLGRVLANFPIALLKRL
ncbi:MAG: malto-oligosyltrehalose synthase [Gammaproteobacteria bacterium]|nr:malto-oligosyltrehalose synthase [Gammaproteobacteria bacterium]MCP5458418.1 malto-oligosyltrehalose synthase [Gammaproteobacteria bacterium]